jgi:RNA polymerase-binding protein DksA
VGRKAKSESESNNGSENSNAESYVSHGKSSGNGNGSKLSAEDIEKFRELLLAKRHELFGDMNGMQEEALSRSRTDAAGDLSSMPIHMADIGSDNYEQEFTLDLIDNEKEMVKEIDEALNRIDKGTFGVCEATGKPIGKNRLKLQPWAKYCMDYLRDQESKQKQR